MGLLMAFALGVPMPQAGGASPSASSAPPPLTATPPATPPAPPPDVPLQVIPRATFSWKSDSLGQVIGESMACPPLPGRVKSVAPSAPLPAPLSSRHSGSSLRISATAGKGLSRDIAVLQWVGPVITWKRMPVPLAQFEPSLKALAAWMMTNFLVVTLEDGSVVRVGTESQRVTVTLGTAATNAATAALADVPAGMTLAVPGTVPMPEGGMTGSGPFLIEMARSPLAVRIATYPDTILDIEVTDAPAQLRVSAMTPSGAELERALAELSMTEQLLSGAPPDQRRILEGQRAEQQSAADELRKRVATERIRPTGEPIKACIWDPASGREFITIMIEVKEGHVGVADAAAGGAASGQDQGVRSGSAARKPPPGRWGAP